MDSEAVLSKSISLQELPVSRSDVKNSDQVPSPRNAVDRNSFPQTELISVDEPGTLQQTSPDTTTPSSSGNISDQGQGKVFAEVVEAAKAGDLAKIINLVSSLTESSPPSMNPLNAQPTSSATVSNDPAELVLPNVPEGINAVIQNEVNPSQTATVSSTASDTPATAASSSTENNIPTVVSSSTPPPPQTQSSSSSSIEEPKILPTPSDDEKPKDCKPENPQPVNELTGPPLSEPPVAPSVAVPTTVWGTPAALPPKPVCVTPANFTTDINVQLTVLNATGELSPVHLCLPEHPLIILRVNPIQGARVGQVLTLSFSTQMILKTISSILDNGAVYNGAPIIIPISTSPLPPASTSAPNTESASKTIAVSAPAPLPLGMKSAALSGARKMRAIAPKPSNSVAGSVPVSSVATAAMRSASVNRPARKLFAAPVAPNPLTLPNPTSTIAPANTPIVNPNPLVTSINARSASILRKMSTNSPNSRNRNRRKNLSATLPPPPPPPPVTVAVSTTTAIVPQSTGYIVDPTSGAFISTDASTVSGGFIQSIMQSGPNGPQFFAPTGSILVGSSNGLIPMPISGVIPADTKPSEAETGDLIANAGNPYQSGFLVPADGSNDGFPQQVLFTNGGAPNGQFLLPSYQTNVPSGEYVQSFPTQQAEYLQTNGGEIFFTSDGSCYMPYTGIIGQPQPVATVDIKDDGTGVDVVSETDDIIDIAMRVAREDVDCNIAVTGTAVATETVNIAPTTIELTDDTNGVISEFIQLSTVPPPGPSEFEENQTIEHVSPVIEESVLTGSQQTSTGDAKIDALLAEAALVSSVNGVGDNQSAVSVPVTSLLGSRTGVPTTTVAASNTDTCTIVEANAADMSEFSQSLYDSFANFEAAMIPDPVPSSSTKAATEAAFTYVTQKVGDLDAEFGTTAADLDATPTHAAESFLKSLVNQADDLDAGITNKKELNNVTECFEDHKEPDGPSQNDTEEVTSQAEMADLFQLPFGRNVDDDVTGGDSDDTFFPFSRDYTTPEQFDAALQLLGSQPSSNCSPPRVPDDVEDADDEAANKSCCDDAPIVPDSPSIQEQDLVAGDKPHTSESKPVGLISFGDSLLPPDLTLNATIHDSSPVGKLKSDGGTLSGEYDRMPSPDSASAMADGREQALSAPINIDVEEEDDDSGSELDFLPSRKRPEPSETQSTSPKELSSPLLPPPSPLTPSAQLQPNESIFTVDVSNSPHPVPPPTSSSPSATLSRKSPKLPRQSTPRVKSSRRKSVSSPISPNLRRSGRRVVGGTSSTPVSPRQLRSRSKRKEGNSMEVSEEEPSDDILPLKDTILKDLNESEQTLCLNQSQDDSATLPMLGNEVASSSRLTLDSTLPTEPCIEESTVLCTGSSPPSTSKKRLKANLCSLAGESARSTISATPTIKGSHSEEITSSFWDLTGTRPTSFGLSDTSGISSLIPVNKFESRLELKNNPILQSDKPFWSDPLEPPSTDEEDETEDEDKAELVGQDEDSESDSSPSLLATIRAASLALNLPFNPPIALPGNETAFTQFASSVSLPSFDAFVPPAASNDEPQNAVVDATSTTTGADVVEDDDDDESEGNITPNSWLPDPTKLVFSQSLFPPKFSPPSISQLSSIPVLHFKNSRSFSAIAEAAPGLGTFGTSLTDDPSRSEDNHPQHPHQRPLHETKIEMLNVSSQEEVTVDESLSDTKHLPLQCEVISTSRLVSPVGKVIGPSTIDPPPVAPQSSTPPVQIIDLPASSGIDPASLGSDCAPESKDQKSKMQPPILLKLKLSNIKPHHKKANRKRKMEHISPQRKKQESLGKEAPSPPKRGKISTILRFSRVDGMFRTQTIPVPQPSSIRVPTPPPPEKASSTATLNTPPPNQPIWAAAKPSRCARRGTGGRGSRGGKSGSRTECTAAAPICLNDGDTGNRESHLDSQPPLIQTVDKIPPPALSKKFFSSSKEDRRSSAIRTARPWRTAFGNMIRRRGRFCGSTDRAGLHRTSSSNQSVLPSTSPTQPSQSLPPTQCNTTSSPSSPIRLVIRLSKEKDTSGETNQILTNLHVGDSHFHETEGSTTVTSNGEETGDDDGGEDRDEEVEEGRSAGVELASNAAPAHQFFVAPEAETFIDKNQARVRLVLNRALYAANGIDPGGDDDDDEDDEEEEKDSSFSRTSSERLRRMSAVKTSQASHCPDVSAEQHYGSHQLPHRGNQPTSYASQPPPTSIYNPQPPTAPPLSSSSGTAIFSPLRCEMATASSGMQQARPSVEGVSSARSSSTTSGSLPAPSTISPPAPFAIATTTSEAESNGGGGGPSAHDQHQNLAVEQQQHQHFYQRQPPRQFGDAVEGGEQGPGQRSYTVPKIENASQPATPVAPVYSQESHFARQLRDFPTMPSQQHHQQQALAAACAAAAAAYVGNFEPATMQAMWASSFLNNLGGAPRGYAQSQQPALPSYNPYSQQQHPQQQQARGHLENSHDHQQQQQQQPVFPPYREGDASHGHTNEAHQQPPYPLPSHFTNRVIPDNEALNYYSWHSHQYQQSQQQGRNAAQLRAIDRAATYYSAASTTQQHQQQTSAPHPNTGLSSQWYQSSGVVQSSASQSHPAALQPTSSTPGYSQIDDTAVVAAVAAAGYRLPPFPRLS